MIFGGRPTPSGPAAHAGGEPATLTELFRAHHLELVRLAVLMTGDLATAEDVVQDVFERLHRRWPGRTGQEVGLAYARVSVMNGCRSAHRRVAVRRKYTRRVADQDQHSPDAAAATADRGALAAALRMLPDRQRKAIVLRFYCDLDVAEIAQMLGIGPSSVRSTISRALATLARLVAEEER